MHSENEAFDTRRPGNVARTKVSRMAYEELKIESQNRMLEMGEHPEPKLRLEVHPASLNGETRANRTPNNPPRVPVEGEVISPPSSMS